LSTKDLEMVTSRVLHDFSIVSQSDQPLRICRASDLFGERSQPSPLFLLLTAGF
jgi:hypothetical protein